ncbi:hypothetical protein ACFW9N_43570 [Streptomyces sp. NPDC059496]|uniref:hypothetical protein n=1 Tax=Streptomyces sp. NPDC059496 TaxID=3346851 RepID=UPI00368F7141
MNLRIVIKADLIVNFLGTAVAMFTLAGILGVPLGLPTSFQSSSWSVRSGGIAAVVGLIPVHLYFARWLRASASPRKIVLQIQIGSPKVGLRLARGTASLAARLAGGRRDFYEAFQADLDGYPDGGRVLSPRAQWRHAAGLLKAALKMRLRDLARPCWTPVDWILRSNTRTNAFITATVGALVIYIQATSGLHTLLLEGLHSCAIVGAGLYGLSRWLRKIRDVQPPEVGN